MTTMPPPGDEPEQPTGDAAAPPPAPEPQPPVPPTAPPAQPAAFEPPAAPPPPPPPAAAPPPPPPPPMGTPTVTPGGYPGAPMGAPMMGGIDPGMADTQKKAQNSLIISIIGLICCAPLAILSLIWARQALEVYARMPGAPGEGQAKAAQVISIIALVLWALGFIVNVALL